MNPKNIEQQITDYTIQHSQYDTNRNYIGLSQVIKTKEEIINDFLQGTEVNESHKLKCYKGYQMEKDLVNRCKSIWGKRISHRELEAFGGIVKGNPDFFLDNYPVDVKSILLDEHFPEKSKIPKRSYYQMQAYLLYSKSKMGYLIYESRETGKIKVYSVYPNFKIQQDIAIKIEDIVETLKKSIE